MTAKSIPFKFEKQQHDCYSHRRYDLNGELVEVLWTCPTCGPWIKWQKGMGLRHLQKPNGINHSGVSLRKWGE